MIFDTPLFYGIIAACLICSAVSFGIMVFFRLIGSKSQERPVGNRRHRAMLRTILNVGAVMPIGLVAVGILWALWLLQSAAGMTIEFQLSVMIACVVLYFVLLMATVFFFRVIGKNKPRKEGDNRSRPVLRGILNVAAWLPLGAMITFFIWLKYHSQ